MLRMLPDVVRIAWMWTVVRLQFWVCILGAECCQTLDQHLRYIRVEQERSHGGLGKLPQICVFVPIRNLTQNLTNTILLDLLVSTSLHCMTPLRTNLFCWRVYFCNCNCNCNYEISCCSKNRPNCPWRIAVRRIGGRYPWRMRGVSLRSLRSLWIFGSFVILVWSNSRALPCSRLHLSRTCDTSAGIQRQRATVAMASNADARESRRDIRLVKIPMSATLHTSCALKSVDTCAGIIQFLPREAL